MNMSNICNNMGSARKSAACKLYEKLCEKEYREYPFKKQEVGDGMCVICQLFGEYWKPRYLLDKRNKKAVEFLDSCAKLQTVSVNDIDWDSLEGLPQDAIERAQALDAYFPTFVRGYNHDVAEMSWQLNPDGRYYMDDDGYGMTDDEEITLYCYIDRLGKPLVKIRCINNFSELEQMEQEAIKILKYRR